LPQFAEARVAANHRAALDDRDVHLAARWSLAPWPAPLQLFLELSDARQCSFFGSTLLFLGRGEELVFARAFLDRIHGSIFGSDAGVR